MSRRTRPFPKSTIYLIPMVVAASAMVNLGSAFIKGYVVSCSGSRHNSMCSVLSAGTDADQFQRYLDRQWLMLAGSVLIAFVVWRIQQRRARATRS